MRAGEI